jgi:hypothetical protein
MTASTVRAYIAVSLGVLVGYWLAYAEHGSWAAAGHTMAKLFN